MSFQQQLAEASESQLRQLKNDPRLYIRNSWTHPNDRSRNYDFKTTDGEKTLHYLIDDDGPLNPYEWGGVNILLLARGLLKTTTMEAIANWGFQFYGPHGLETYMAAPRQGQVREFSGKLSEKLEWSGLDQYRQKDAIEHQKFKFTPNGQTVYSHFKADSGWGQGDAMRGPHSHLGIYDEFQDASPKSFNAGFYEVIDQSIAGVPFFPTMFLLGTPKMEGSFFEEMWEKSDKREWYPDKGENGMWVAQDDPQQYGTGDDAMEVHGWHVDQIKAPLHTESDIAAKRDMKTEQEFVNEVLAKFYSPEDHLLSERHIDNICDPELSFHQERRYEDSWITMGIDWGGGSDRKAADTVITVMEHVKYDDEQIESIYNDVEFVDESASKNEEFETVETKILQYDPEVIVVDEGYGSKRREDLQAGTNTLRPNGYDNVVGCRFGNISSTQKVKWKDDDDKKLFTADKSYMAKAFVDFVKAERMTLPSSQISTGAHGGETKGAKIYRQLTAPYEEKRETKSGRKKKTITSRSGDNDDLFDSSIYAWMGRHADQLGPTETTYDFGGHEVPGTV